MRGSLRAGGVRIILATAPLAAVAIGALIYVGGGGATSALTGSVQVVGSETMRPVVAACAEAFMARNPRADVIVKGGGSGDGIAAVLHGIADMGMTSREISRRERDYAMTKGIALTVVDLALDGVTVIIHRANPIDALSFDQLRDIYSGSIRNWRELGGPESEIVVHARAAGSGTASMFSERILGDLPYGPAVQRLPTNTAIVAAVAAQPGALGYTGFAALRPAGERIRAIPLRDAQGMPVAPTAETIRTRRYPLARTLYLGVAGTPAGTVKEFLDFCTGPAGRALIQRAGYVEESPPMAAGVR
jgi:phosphate transport system substrate-binding protein